MSQPERVLGEVLDESQRSQTKIPTQYIGLFLSGDTSPDIQDCNKWICNATVVIITNFDHGQDGQELVILGHNNTTIKNNANIQTNTGVDKVLVSGLVYRYTMFQGQWHEDE